MMIAAISSSLYYEGGQPSYRNLFMLRSLATCHFFDGRGIVANPRTEGRFNKSYYGDLSEVIRNFWLNSWRKGEAETALLSPQTVS